MSEQNITASLWGAVIGWAFMGLFGIPLAVYFDLLQGWRWLSYLIVRKTSLFWARMNSTDNLNLSQFHA